MDTDSGMVCWGIMAFILSIFDDRPLASEKPLKSCKLRNLICVLLTTSSSADDKLLVSLFNARSVGTAEKRTKICNFVQDQNIDILFLTETWLTAKGDETKCADMCPAGYSAKSFPRLSRGGGLAVIYRSSLQRYISVDATFDFDHTAFELLHLKLSVSQCAIHFLCLYRPPPSKKNRLTESMFFDQIPDMLEFCNQLKGNLLILGDFNIHFDRAESPATVRMNDLLRTFDLDQAVREPTHSHGHILDWIIHRQSDDLSNQPLFLTC